MQQTSRKPLTIAAIVVVLFFGGLIILSRNLSFTPDPGPSGNSGADENTPAASGSSFIGYDSLLNVGVTVDQVSALQKALQQYKPMSTTGTTIDMSKGTLTPYAPSQRDPLLRPSIGTSVVVNQKTTYRITFYYWGTSSIELLIYDSTGKTKLFDSGTVTATN